jgi:hypothetical protein
MCHDDLEDEYVNRLSTEGRLLDQCQLYIKCCIYCTEMHIIRISHGIGEEMGVRA